MCYNRHVKPDVAWLLLAFQLPPKAGALRVRVWRRLQAIGAAALKTSLYALPPRPGCREDFEWLVEEIRSGGGSATLIEGRLLAGVRDHELRARLVEARDAEYRVLAGALRKSGRRPRAAALARARRELAEIEARDYYGADGRESALALLRAAEQALEPGARKEDGNMSVKSKALKASLSGKTWVTRADVGVDRIACAWLIRTFVDASARFRFLSDPGQKRRAGEVRFDMLDAEFTHEGERCTFETLLHRLDLRESALARVAELVHDLDLKDQRYRRPEAAGVAAVLAGIRRGSADDLERLRRGGELFDDLYRQFGGRVRSA